ncbi:hypothetical protein JC2156_05560 [Weissella koreensis KCTC 3621]|uniref:hypothetical protein n=1 Tax=Weissella koreensis TaxID=165096 RepID=UPI00026F3EE6|nr:hypothetical protein [Weissella koreensis]EJF33742.1 hypothetical protein JC2156_05560 [Weissella koreensis KCTC 3621]
MAKRRMISLDVYDSDDFLDMPTESQNLFSHLVVRADDDGFVSNPKRLRRMLGYGDNVFDLLIAKGYVLAFKTGYVVIAGWPSMNRVEPSKKTITNAKYEISQLRSINKRYELIENADTSIFEDASRKVLEIRQPMSRKVLAQVRLGKDSIGKFSTGQIKDEEEEEINKSLTREREFPTPEQIFENTSQIEQLSLKLLSDFIVDSPEQASICIEALSGQYWRLRRLKDEGNFVVVLKEQAYGIDKGILNIIEEAAKYSLEHTKERLNDFNSFGSYFSTGLINKINTAISSGGNNDATV